MKTRYNDILIWISALVVGTLLGLLQLGWLDVIADFVATVYTRLFQFLAVPTIALAVISTLANIGAKKSTGRVFARTLTYTLLTTFAAAFVGLALYLLIAPENLPSEVLSRTSSTPLEQHGEGYFSYIIGIIPNNVVQPFVSGNVLSILLVSVAIGLGLTFMPATAGRDALLSVVSGLQQLFNTLIRGLIRVLPLGIVAFAAQLSSQIASGVVVGSLGKYVAVIMLGNVVQFVVVLPIFLLLRGLNPWRVLRAMSPAVLMALFTKSSAATLPVTINSAKERLGTNRSIADFTLPICTTINMNGCAAFILVTSLFLMQHTHALSTAEMLVWVLISVFAAVGNAGVPMGCFFLTLSLMTGQNAPVAIMGIILPIYTIIDMVETAENVWSDSCVNAMVSHDLGAEVEQ